MQKNKPVFISMDLPQEESEVISKMITEKKDNKFKRFVKRHKKPIIAGGIVTASSVAIGLLFLKKPELLSQFKNMFNHSVVMPSAESAINITKTVPESIPSTTIQYAERAAEMAETVRRITEPFKVKGFVRNLPNGWHASETAIQNALDAGVVLNEGQTYVTEFVKGLASAA